MTKNRLNYPFLCFDDDDTKILLRFVDTFKKEVRVCTKAPFHSARHRAIFIK